MEKIDHSIDYKSDGWDKFYDDKGDSWRDKDYRLLHELFAVKVLKGSLIDVGCGLGDGLRMLRETADGVTQFSGTDFASETIERNKNNPLLRGIDFFSHDITQPLPARYDNVICLQTLEHLHEPALAMNNLINATREVLIVATPYKNRRPDENHLWSFNIVSS